MAPVGGRHSLSSPSLSPSTSSPSNTPLLNAATGPPGSEPSDDPLKLTHQQKKVFRRSYKACINCRQKKIKCDLGDLSNPSDPPCVRCRREGRKCEFSVSRRGGAGNIRMGKQKKMAAAASGLGGSEGNSYNFGGARSSNSVTISHLSYDPEALENRILEQRALEESANVGATGVPEAISEGAGVITETELHNPSDALGILAQAARSQTKIDSRGSNSRVDSPGSNSSSSNNNNNGNDNGTHNCNENQQEQSPSSNNSSSSSSKNNISGTLLPTLSGTKTTTTMATATGTATSASTSTGTAATTTVQANQPLHLKFHMDPTLSPQVTAQNHQSTQPTSTKSGTHTDPPSPFTQYPANSSSRPESSSSARQQQFPSLPNLLHNSQRQNNQQQPQRSSQQHNNQDRHSSNHGTTRFKALPDSENRIQFHHSINDAAVVRENYLTSHEAILFIRFFFDKLHPFYPFIPDEMHSTEVLATMPILLTVILTISSRYCKSAEQGTKYSISSSRGSQIHHSLWNYCQTLVSKTVWGEASTRSIGTVYSFLLLSEWNPRAIHWRFNDYANSPLGDSNDSPQSSVDTSRPKNKGRNKSAQSSQETPEEEIDGSADDNNDATEPPKPVLPPGDTVFSASERSDRMSWLLIGSGIRLAQDLGIFDTNSKVYLATHLSEIVLALRLGRRSMISSWLNEESPELIFNSYEQAKLSILRIMSLAHETLYVSRKTTRNLLKGHKFLAFLNLFAPHLIHWENTYMNLLNELEGESNLERESILFDYHYTRLYIYSLALSNETITYPGQNDGGTFPSDSEGGMSNPLLLSDGLSATKYVGMATDAAREMLAVAYRVHQMDQLCLAPIRWIVRLVHAAVFLVKTVLLTPTGSMYIHKSTVAMIRRTANMLKDSSPDELHLANRYASILLHICHDMAEKCNNFQINEETAPNNNIRAAAAIISAHGNGPLSQQQQDIQLLHRLKDLQKQDSPGRSVSPVNPPSKSAENTNSNQQQSQVQQQRVTPQPQPPSIHEQIASQFSPTGPKSNNLFGSNSNSNSNRNSNNNNNSSGNTTQIMLDGVARSQDHQQQQSFSNYNVNNVSTGYTPNPVRSPSYEDYAPFNHSRYKNTTGQQNSSNNNANSPIPLLPVQQQQQQQTSSVLQAGSLMSESSQSQYEQGNNTNSNSNSSLFLGSGLSPFSNNFSYNNSSSNSSGGNNISSGINVQQSSAIPPTPSFMHFGMLPSSVASNSSSSMPTGTSAAQTLLNVPYSSAGTASGTPNSMLNTFNQDLIFSATFNDMSDFGFNFSEDGFEGLGFVNQLVDNFEVHQINTQRQRRQSRAGPSSGIGSSNN